MRKIAILVCVLLLGGCAAYGAAEGTSVLVTDKTIGDHVVSIYSGKDCSTVRLDKGETYCKEDQINPTPQLYCYRTIGRVTCYDRPNPYQGRQDKVGVNDHNLVRQ